jgi:catalase
MSNPLLPPLAQNKNGKKKSSKREGSPMKKENANDKTERIAFSSENVNEKLNDLQENKEIGTGEFLTTNQGTRINDNQNTLKAGPRGPSLLEDFIFREKITHFDHERIPERVVHARGTGAHGYFQVYQPMGHLTRAHFLQDPGKRTPVFVRFSTVAGFRGSTDLARDVRGFAVKFYTDEGIFDLVGNNIPVFFIQDAIKFPDLIHSVKPEPHNEMPQAASAHDTFWDFISLMPESTHMIMWAMSDRAIPRSYRMMEGFGVHTFRFVNGEGISRFVKFHWKPLLGLHSVLWDEAQKISGKDPDFHRRDLYEAIESGDYPEWEFGVQVVEEKDEHSFDFDLLDPTKIIPEELVPVQRIGKLTLNRVPDNFFAETEQVAFHPGHIVPGIDFTNDPLLQGRLFSYLDTQLLRLGGPNFHEIPINRPIAPVHNNQRDGFMRQTINKSKAPYDPNTLGGGCPFQAGKDLSGFVSHAEKIDAVKVRERSKSFHDHFTQARLFYMSQTDIEKQHIIRAFRFELGKVELPEIRERMLVILSEVDTGLAQRVAEGLGLPVPASTGKPLNQSVPADTDINEVQPGKAKKDSKVSAALSIILSAPKDNIKTRKVAILAADGCADEDLNVMVDALTSAGANAKIVGPRLGYLTTNAGNQVKIHFSLLTASSVLFDAVYVAGGKSSVDAFKSHPAAQEFVFEAYKHCKAIAATGSGVELLEAARISDRIPSEPKSGKDEAVIIGADGSAARVASEFVAAIGKHRNWDRERWLQPER